MRLLALRAFDVVSFGTLKNFTAGESHYQHSDFPPPIMRFFSLGKNLKIMGVFLVGEEEVYMPVPADSLSKRKSQERTVYVPKFHQGLKRPFILHSESLEQAKGFCSFKDFVENYAMGREFDIVDLEKENCVDLEKERCLVREKRVGVKLNYSLRTAEESYLYSRVFLRLQKLSLLLLTEGEWEEKDYITLGGERRVACLEERDVPLVREHLLKGVNINKGKLYKFYATTHLYFEPKDHIKIERLRFSLEWISSQEPEWVSGFAKRFLYMLRPATVLWLRALDDGVVRRLCQISSQGGVSRLMERGWNSGIMMEAQ